MHADVCASNPNFLVPVPIILVCLVLKPSYVHHLPISIMFSLVCLIATNSIIILFFLHSTAAIDCGDPGTPQNGYQELPSTTLGSQVTYRCQQGYVLVGGGTRECMDSGLWSGSLPVCECELTKVLAWAFPVK